MISLADLAEHLVAMSLEPDRPQAERDLAADLCVNILEYLRPAEDESLFDEPKRPVDDVTLGGDWL